VFDTETDLGNGQTGPDEPGGPEQENSGPFGKMMNSQLQWMESDLQAVNRSETPWVVACEYSSGSSHEVAMLIIQWVIDHSMEAPIMIQVISATTAGYL
jgi:hypothetical protein